MTEVTRMPNCLRAHGCDLVHVTLAVQKIIVSLEILINPKVMRHAKTVEMIHFVLCFIQILCLSGIHDKK